MVNPPPFQWTAEQRRDRATIYLAECILGLAKAMAALPGEKPPQYHLQMEQVFDAMQNALNMVGNDR